MKKLFTLFLALSTLAVYAQDVDKAKVQGQAAAAQDAQAGLKSIDTGDKAWKFSGTVGLNAAATGMWNWTAGGNNNISGRVFGNFRLLYHKNAFAWDSNLDMEYGLTWIDQEYDKLQKSSDRFNFQTKLGWEFKKTWYLSGVIGFNTQFANGRKYTGDEGHNPLVSRGLAPAYLDLSVGIDWKPNDIFSVYISPVAGRITTVYISDRVNDEENAYYEDLYDYDLRTDLKNTYGVWKYKVIDETTGQLERNFDSNVRAELGLSFKGQIDYTIKGFNIKTALGLFTPYRWDKREVFAGEEGSALEGMLFVNPSQEVIEQLDLEKIGYMDNNRRFGNFDVDWTVALSYQFLKCLQVTLSTDLRYYNGVKIADKNGENAKERVQFQGVIGLGVGYSF